jgi:hypothetical protein
MCAAMTRRPAGWPPGFRSARTVRPVALGMGRIHAPGVGGRPRPGWWMTPKRRGSMAFPLRMPGRNMADAKIERGGKTLEFALPKLRLGTERTGTPAGCRCLRDRQVQTLAGERPAPAKDPVQGG